jgi:hypothetical protein
MYEFNPMTSMELLQNLRQPAARPADDAILDDPERHVQPARPATFGDFVRRVFQRISSKRRAA